MAALNDALCQASPQIIYREITLLYLLCVKFVIQMLSVPVSKQEMKRSNVDHLMRFAENDKNVQLNQELS